MGNLLLHDNVVWPKKCWATYKRMATALLHDTMHNEVEVYMRDLEKSPSKKEREIFVVCFLRHLSFWVSGVESPLIFYVQKIRKTNIQILD